MKRPSKRSILIGSGFFAAGFIVAIALSGGFVTWLLRQDRSAVQSHFIDGLVDNNRLLAVADKSPNKLVAAIVADTHQNSEMAAAVFGYLTKQNQAMVLRQFTRLNQSPTLRADQNQTARTALLARLMVLCSRDSAYPGSVNVNKHVTVFTGTPDWVLDPGATPAAPTPVPNAEIKQTPEVLAAELDHWTKLHDWVKANQACITKQETIP